MSVASVTNMRYGCGLVEISFYLVPHFQLFCHCRKDAIIALYLLTEKFLSPIKFIVPFVTSNFISITLQTKETLTSNHSLSHLPFRHVEIFCLENLTLKNYGTD